MQFLQRKINERCHLKSTVEKVFLFNIKRIQNLNKTPICYIPKFIVVHSVLFYPLGVIITDLPLCQSSLCFVFKASGLSQASVGAALLGHSQCADTPFISQSPPKSHFCTRSLPGLVEAVSRQKGGW